MDGRHRTVKPVGHAYNARRVISRRDLRTHCYKIDHGPYDPVDRLGPGRFRDAYQRRISAIKPHGRATLELGNYVLIFHRENGTKWKEILPF